VSICQSLPWGFSAVWGRLDSLRLVFRCAAPNGLWATYARRIGWVFEERKQKCSRERSCCQRETAAPLAGMLRVRRTLTTTKGGPQLATPKTKGSRRTVRLTQGALNTLRSHLLRQLGEIDSAGSLWQENGLIFASEAGDPLDRRYVTNHRFKPLLKRAGLPQIRFHD